MQTSTETQASINILGDYNKRSLIELGLLSNQTQALSEIQRTREKDSKAIKALTAMSTLYLPASLVATVFTSDLVQLLPVESAHQAVHFALAPQAWIAVLVAGTLISLTYLGVRILEGFYLSAVRKREQKSQA